MNDRITASAWAAARKEISVPTKPGQCLSLARRVIEHALYRGEYRFYADYLVTGSSMRQGEQVGRHRVDPWASDLEASCKQLGYFVKPSDRRAGDIIFHWRGARPYGHVGVLLDRDTVLENIRPEWRPHSIHLGSWLSLTPLEHFKYTSIARLRPRP